MRIPSRHSILARANDQRAAAVQQDDRTTVRQLDTLIGNLHRGMKMRWNAGDTLSVRSANTAGKEYTVTEQACDCPAFTPCNHARLRELLLDMAQTQAKSMDIAADPPGENPLGDEVGDTVPERRAWPLRIATIRARSSWYVVGAA